MQPARHQFPAFRLGCVLPQTAQITLCKTRPDVICFWLIVSCFGQKNLVWKQATVQESSGPFLGNASEPIWIRCKSDLACLLGNDTHRKARQSLTTVPVLALCAHHLSRLLRRLHIPRSFFKKRRLTAAASGMETHRYA